MSTRSDGTLTRSWEETQISTFTRWCNTKLSPHNVSISSVTTDFSDGTRLCQLLETLTGQEMETRWHRTPKMRFQMLENCNLALTYIQTEMQIRLVAIGGSDIVDQNTKLTLGMIWSVIAKYHIDAIMQTVVQEGENARDALLNWCRSSTDGHDGGSLRDFSASWSSGLGICALINRYVPEVLNYAELDPSDKRSVVTTALDALKLIGIPVFLDVADLVDVERPDDKAVITQAAELYRCLDNPKWVAEVRQRFGRSVDINERIRALIADSKGERKDVLVGLQSNLQPLQRLRYCGLCEVLFQGIEELWKLVQAKQLEIDRLRRLVDQAQEERAAWNAQQLENDESIAELREQLENAGESRPNRELILQGLKFEYGHGILKNEREAFQCYRQAAGLNDSDGLFSLGRVYEKGIGVEIGVQKAAEYYRLASDLKNYAAMNNLGVLKLRGSGVPKDESGAVELFEEAAGNGSITAQFNLSVCLDLGKGIEVNHERAIALLKAAAEKGHPRAMNNLGFKLENGEGVEQNHEEALKLFNEAAAKESAHAIFNVATFSTDQDAIIQLWQRAADLGSADAMNNLGVVTALGHGVLQNEAKGAALVKRAGEKGITDAVCNFGVMLREGRGTEANGTAAVRLLKFAAERGSVAGMTNYAVELAQGENTRENKVEAAKWMAKAAENGESTAQFNCGIMNAYGIGVAKDRAAAIRYFRAAVEKGYEEASKYLKPPGYT
jgi:TPR repeat protein